MLVHSVKVLRVTGEIAQGVKMLASTPHNLTTPTLIYRTKEGTIQELAG